MLNPRLLQLINQNLKVQSTSALEFLYASFFATHWSILCPTMDYPLPSDAIIGPSVPGRNEAPEIDRQNPSDRSTSFPLKVKRLTVKIIIQQ